MLYIVNDLSIYKGFSNHDDLVDSLEILIKTLNSNRNIKSNFYITNTFSNISVDDKYNVSNVIFKLEKTNRKILILNWLDRSRLFWNDQRTHNNNDYFEHNDIDVTDQGLGECSRRVLIDNHVTSFSFGKNFCQSIITIKQGLPEEILAIIDVNNIWDINKITEISRQERGAPRSWNDAIDFMKHDYSTLNLSEKLIEQISIQPFNIGICNRFFELCKALDEIIRSRESDNSFTELTYELVAKYFHGDKAWFTDESDDDKRDFENDLKFYPPNSNVKKKYTFHGKIKIEQIRIYIEWPLKPEHKTIDIVYFGPKITKK